MYRYSRRGKRDYQQGFYYRKKRVSGQLSTILGGYPQVLRAYGAQIFKKRRFCTLKIRIEPLYKQVINSLLISVDKLAIFRNGRFL